MSFLGQFVCIAVFGGLVSVWMNDRVDFIGCAGWFRFRGAFSTVV